ncbi:MAG: hypothetical protein JNK82_04230 [Myxococcaceae bacterium]|nr:hypothetical protein [Myxococcaceae bacterium]
MTALPIAHALFVSAVSLSTSTVPAEGRQTATVTLDKAAMVRLSATSQSGTSCDVVDRVRGPFARSGEAGTSNCQLDLLLDAGTYQLRLESAKRGKGKVTLAAAELVELNPTPSRLTEHALQHFDLKSGQQASFWLTVKRGTVPALRVSGRTAGDVRLWRNGEWVEAVAFEAQTVSPEPGRPIHEWWLNPSLESGDYLVRIYGTNAHAWAGGNENDEVEVALGHRDGPSGRALAFTLGRSGVTTVRIPPQGWANLLTLDATPTAPVELHVDTTSTSRPACRIERKALVPQCAGWAYDRVSHVLYVRGPAGTKGLVEWGPLDGNGWYGGYYGTASVNVPFRSQGGLNLVALHDLPLDTDAAPLGCMLVANDQRLAWDFPAIGAGASLDTKFNYDGSGQLVWFDVKSSGRYRIEAKGGRKSRCELYRFAPTKPTLERISQTSVDTKACSLTVMLNEGSHQLSLFEGNAGIEQLVITEEGRAGAKPIPPKAGCLLPSTTLLSGAHTLHTNRAGRISARGVVVEQLPLRLDVPLHLTLDPGKKVSLPLARSTAAIAHTSAGATLAVGPETIELNNPGAEPLGITVYAPSQLPATAGLEKYAPKLEPLAIAKADAPVFFDFDRDESHSMVFQVEQPGLYHVSTQGLLATRCALRTPVNPDVARDSGGGRGRNCLVSGYLKPGRYMLTATTVGESRGRASVLLTRRPLQTAAALSGGGDTFFRAGAGDLIQQKLVVTKAGTYELATTAQGAGAGLKCRLDDGDGWPLTAVPTSCNAPRTFKAGTYGWSQLPLTVESMRHTHLQRVVPPAVLTGNKPHALDFFTWYQARLGNDGRDELTFKLDGAAEVDVVLTNGMQGRLFLLGEGKSAKAIEVVPSSGSSGAPELQAVHDEDAATPDEPVEPIESYPCEGEDCGEAPAVPAAQPLVATDAPPPPGGHKVKLEAGSYRLVTEHARGDVAIDYQVHLGSAVLMPGMTRTLATPARLPISVPRDGTLKLRTRGEADVRCRLFDRAGQLVLEGRENGPDWNCSLAEPIAKGDYTLVLESETQSRSLSTLSLQLAATESRGVATDGARYELKSAVQIIEVPKGDAVQVLTFTSGKAPFSCALEDASGAVLARRSRVTGCTLHVRPKTETYRVRLWAAEGAPVVTAALASKPAVSVALATAGRFKTAAGAMCLSAARSGLMRPCGPEVSLEAGEHVFADAVTPTEVAQRDAATQTLSLWQQPWLQAVDAPGRLVLLEARVGHGERAAPACSFGAGAVHELTDTACFAASGISGKPVARVWAATTEGAAVNAAVRMRPVALPDARIELKAGRQRIDWAGEAVVLALPARPARASLMLPAGAWAVHLSGAQAVGLCAPKATLAHCALSGTGGTLVLVSDVERRAEVALDLLEAPQKQRTFDGLYEAVPRVAGVLQLDVAAAAASRTLVVEGDVRCVTALADGARLTGCRVELPAGQAAEVEIDHAAGPLRVLAFAAGRELQARLGVQPPALPPPPVAASTEVSLASGRTDRTLVVERDAVVHLSAEAGVCGLFKGAELLAVDGFGRGCELVRVLPPGTYRAVVRPFDGVVASATFRWSSEPVLTLADGVGGEDWLAPSQSRVYRFATKSKGNVGLGVQAVDEALDCSIYDEQLTLLGEGCQQFLLLEKGSYLLSVKLPAKRGAAPLKFKPVLLGLAGAKAEVPREYLEELFRRSGGGSQ